ncbi:unnamed protein product, partial [Rotaria socialis]
LSQGLECYQHDFCHGSCPELSKSVVQCKKEDDECWKMSSPLGTKRGCGARRCGLQLNIGILNSAHVCCKENRCNSSIQIKITKTSIIITSLIAFIYFMM